MLKNIKGKESENLQNKNMKYKSINTRTKYPCKLISKTIEKHRQFFKSFKEKCRFDFSFRDKDGCETTIVN